MRKIIGVLALMTMGVGCGSSTENGAQLGDSYDAYKDGGGIMCGSGPSGGSVYCKPGDHCSDASSAKCVTVLSGPYDAYYNAGGPRCGLGPSGGSVFCKPGDACVALDAASCTHNSDGSYGAYEHAGGALCGEGPSGGSVYCKPGDTCSRPGVVDQTTGLCQ